MITKTQDNLEFGGSVVKLVADAAGISEWIPVSMNTGLLLDATGGTATVEQATELPSVINDGVTNDKYKAWSLGVISSSTADSIVIGATHVRLNASAVTSSVSLMIRRG